MTRHQEYTTEHTLTVDAPALELYGLVADAARWPAILEPCLHVQYLEQSEGEQRFEIWAQVGGDVSSWTSRRTLDPGALRIGFFQEKSREPIGTMAGAWEFRELPGGQTELVLLHTFTAVDDEPETARWITEALDRNSNAELAALAAVATSGHRVDEVVFSFTDTLELPGRAADAYSFVHRADRWAEDLPHVDGVLLEEYEGGVQDLRMETVTADGSTHTTRSTRICRGGSDPSWIAYKQLVRPQLLRGHSGQWTFTEGDGTGPAVATATHTVHLDPAAVADVLGAGSTLEDARAYIREALGRNSLATLSYAAAHAAARRQEQLAG